MRKTILTASTLALAMFGTVAFAGPLADSPCHKPVLGAGGDVLYYNVKTECIAPVRGSGRDDATVDRTLGDLGVSTLGQIAVNLRDREDPGFRDDVIRSLTRD